MKSIEIRNKTAVWLLIVFVMAFGQVTKEGIDKSNDFPKQTGPIATDGLGAETEVYIMPDNPCLGDEIEIICYLKASYRHLPKSKTEFRLIKGAKLTRGELVQIHPPLRKGETAKFSIKVEIISRHLLVDNGVSLHVPSNLESEWYGIGGRTIDMLIFAENDTISYEKYGNDIDLWTRIGPEYQYDIIEGVRIPPLGRFSEEVQKIREEIEELKVIDPTLSDWDALQLLHDALYEMVVRYGIHEKQESMLILIKARKLMKEKGLSKWEAVDRIVEEVKKQKGRINFFRPDGNGDNGHSVGFDSIPKQRVDITISGTIKNKKHLASKDTGLDTMTVDVPLRHAKVWIRGYWWGQSAMYFGPASTNNNGHFSFTIGGVYAPGYFLTLVFLRRPGVGSEFDRIKVISDSLRFSFIPPPEDSNIWRYRWKLDTLFSSTDIGTRYCAEYLSDGGLWPDNHQPRSGAANIFDNMIKAYEYCVDSGYTTSDTVRKAVAIWEPGYKNPTMSKLSAGSTPDSMFVAGDTTGDINSWTDEWDDWSVLHEFGHHVMAKCASPFPPCTTSFHYWHKKYSNDKNLAYVEGWANFFAGVVTDSIYQINTKKGIGAINDTTYFHNIEDPWDYLFTNPPWSQSFEGGPWCEGSVAGALWDIYDSHDEVPYDTHPSPGFPDTALADTLTEGFTEVWHVFDDYDPPIDTILSCQNIFQFRSGWNSYSYDHEFALNQILLHHRIGDNPPAAPTGLSAQQVQSHAHLCWNKNSESDLEGYRIYRCWRIGFGEFSDWSVTADKTSPTDTTHDDYGVQASYTYRYKLTAFDTLHNESQYSDSVQIFVEYWWNPDKVYPDIYLPPIVIDKFGMEISLASGTANVLVVIYDCSGRLSDKKMIRLTAGKPRHVQLTRDAKSTSLPAGVYFARIKIDDVEITRKFIILRLTQRLAY